jgi:sugar phosphate isomerase/epimerase
MRDLAADLAALSINTATVRAQADLVGIIEACARRGISAISPWRDQVHAVGLDRAVRAIRDAGLQLSGYCRGGMFPADPTKIGEARDDNRRAVDEAVRLGAPCLILVAGGLPQFSRPDSGFSRDLSGARRMVEDGIADLLRYSIPASMPLAIEPLHPMYAADRACVNTLGQALDICDRLDAQRSGSLGVACDVYHLWWDPDLERQIARAADRLFAYHVCDWLVPTTDLLEDRGMMGDGVIDLKRIRTAIEAAGYDRHVEVEIFSKRWWSEPIETVLETCIERYHRCV